MQIVKKLWVLIVIAVFSTGAAFSAVGFLQAGFLSLPSVPPSLNDGNNLDASHGLLNGYKGYRHHRMGYRHHADGWWYPKAAFGDAETAKKQPLAPQSVTFQSTLPSTKNFSAVKPPQEATKQEATKQEATKVVQKVSEKNLAKNLTAQEYSKPKERAKLQEVKNTPKVKDKKGSFSKKHAQWCAKKYRTYRRGDNSFQPAKGKRKACHSPYS